MKQKQKINCKHFLGLDLLALKPLPTGREGKGVGHLYLTMEKF